MRLLEERLHWLQKYERGPPPSEGSYYVALFICGMVLVHIVVYAFAALFHRENASSCPPRPHSKKIMLKVLPSPSCSIPQGDGLGDHGRDRRQCCYRGASTQVTGAQSHNGGFSVLSSRYSGRETQSSFMEAALRPVHYDAWSSFVTKEHASVGKD